MSLSGPRRSQFYPGFSFLVLSYWISIMELFIDPCGYSFLLVVLQRNSTRVVCHFTGTWPRECSRRFFEDITQVWRTFVRTLCPLKKAQAHYLLLSFCSYPYLVSFVPRFSKTTKRFNWSLITPSRRLKYGNSISVGALGFIAFLG